MKWKSWKLFYFKQKDNSVNMLWSAGLQAALPLPNINLLCFPKKAYLRLEADSMLEHLLAVHGEPQILSIVH